MANDLPDAPWITGRSDLPDAPWALPPGFQLDQLPTFQVQHGGETYQVQAPDVQSAVRAVSAVTGKSLPPGFELDKAPAYGSPEFDKAIAEKYGARPQDVAQLRNSMGQSEALRGIPVLGGLIDRLGGYAASSPLAREGGAAGGTFAERAAANEAMQREVAAAFQAAHPGQSAAAQLIGGGTALGGLGMTAA